MNSLEKLMAIDELNEYHESSEKCRSMKELMLDDAARLVHFVPETNTAEYKTVYTLQLVKFSSKSLPNKLDYTSIIEVSLN